MSGRASVEQSRERQTALLLVLERAFLYEPLTQDEIVRELEIDEYPVATGGPRKVKAYQGNEATVRQKFERDKARIRELGFVIETVPFDDGRVGYRIDPASGYAPAIDFTPEERRVVQLALAFCGFGQSGALTLFNDGPSGDGGLSASYYLTPILRALHLQRALSFDYASTATKRRVVEPLLLTVRTGATYLIARSPESGEIKGYRLDRITSMPTVRPEPAVPDEESLAAAKAWRPQFGKALEPVEIVVSTNGAVAAVIARDFPSARVTEKKSGAATVDVRFSSPRAAMAFLLDAGDRVRLESPKELRQELRAWLKGVNVGEAPDPSTLHFAESSSPSVLGQTLQLLHAVYASEDGLSVSELARRFSLEPDLVRTIMNRLVCLEPMFSNFRDSDPFPAHLMVEFEDPEHETDGDARYFVEEVENPHVEPRPLMWRDLFELNVALREAGRVYDSPAMRSAIEKIEEAARLPIVTESADNEGALADVERAIAERQRIKIDYLSASDEEPRVRSIEPREIKVLNGHAYVRAYCLTRDAWRTFRVDRIGSVLASEPAAERPPDGTTNWLTEIGEGGDEVVVVIAPPQRWLFETLPGAQWLALDDGRWAVRFRLQRAAFLDQLMVRAGPGAVVATPEYASAGHELARRMLANL